MAIMSSGSNRRIKRRKEHPALVGCMNLLYLRYLCSLKSGRPSLIYSVAGLFISNSGFIANLTYQRCTRKGDIALHTTVEVGLN